MAYRRKSTTSRRRTSRGYSNNNRRTTSVRRRRVGATRSSVRRSGTQTVRVVIEQPQATQLPLGLTMGTVSRSGPKH